VLKELLVPLIEEGWTRPQKNIAEGIIRIGADGVVRYISDRPGCASKVASQLFLIAQPPLYEEGTISMRSEFTSVQSARQDCLNSS